MDDGTVTKKLFWKAGTRCTKQKHSSKSKGVLSNLVVVEQLLCKTVNYEASPEIKD